MSNCLHCGKELPKEKKRNKFCNNSCSASFNNKGVKRNFRDYVHNPIERPPKKEKTCIHCGKNFTPKRNRDKTCSKECYEEHRLILLKENARKGGRVSAAKTVKRSKKEIQLYELFAERYKVFHNQAIFNGWDADIIIPSLKIAILWNGRWHYKKILEKHSVLQVQNRDWIKINEFIKAGYNFYIVKDCDNKMTPQKAFDAINSLIEKNHLMLAFFSSHHGSGLRFKKTIIYQEHFHIF